MADERKQAEIEYPLTIPPEGRDWLRTKPFRNDPRETARHLIDAGYVFELLELQAGMSLCELGCGPGWLTRFAARHGVEAAGYDISPEMIAIAREQADAEGVAATFEVADMEGLDLGRRFDACVLYDALHHSSRPDLVVQAAQRALAPGGRLLLVEPNWKHRFQGREAAGRFGVTERGYSARQLKRVLRDSGFERIERFHNNRKRLYGNSLRGVASHLAEPFVYRALAPFWTQIWLRARAR